MHLLVKNILRGVKKRLFQYLGISFLLIIIVATMTGLYGSCDRFQSAFSQVEQNSGVYDYRIAIERLNSYKDIESALRRIKSVIKKQFPNTLPEYEKIVEQVEKITVTELENNSLPETAQLNEDLEEYLLNWGVNYKAILINDILNNEFKNNEVTGNYHVTKSFLKWFADNKNEKKSFFIFEDAFYLDSIPFDHSNLTKESEFNFSPTRNHVNEVYLVAGKKPAATNEIVINPDYAKKNNIELNSTVEFLTGEKLKVVGFGYSYWGIFPPLRVDTINASPSNTTQVFATREWLNKYLETSWTSFSHLNTPFFLKVANKDYFFINRIEGILNDTFNFNFGSLIKLDSEDERSGLIRQTFDLQDIIYSAISFIVLLAAIFIVLSYVKKEIELQKKQIGLIKALGYRNIEISFGFTMLFFLLSIISTSIGFLLGVPLQLRFNNLSDLGFFLPLSSVFFSWTSLVIGVIISTIIFTITSFFQSYSKLNHNPLHLIDDRSSDSSSKLLAILKKPFNKWKFKPKLAMSFALKSIGKLSLIFLIFTFASFLLMFLNVANDIFENKLDSLYGYLNKDIYYKKESINMYNFDENDHIKSQIYDWVLEKQLDPNKKITSETFHIDSKEKYDSLNQLLLKDLKGYYIPGSEIDLFYQKTNELKDCLKYIRPENTNYISEVEAKALCEHLQAFIFDLKNYAIVVDKKTMFPSIFLGQNVINDKSYPNLEFKAVSAVNWIGHDQGPLVSDHFDIITLYNSIDESNPLAWKNWFNLKEEKGYDIDPVFNSAHQLNKIEVNYLDGFGDIKKEQAYVVPTVISKSLAILNHYKVDDQNLVLINVNGEFKPVVFQIKGITTTNLDHSAYYLNIDDLRRVIDYLDDQNVPRKDSFNHFYSKDKSLVQINNVSIAQLDGNYKLTELVNKNYVFINKLPSILELIKDRFGNIFGSFKAIIEIAKWLTIIALAFVLMIIVNMILDNNLLIIAMMKSLGYRINEINLLIIGSYIFTLIVAFIMGTVLSYVIWQAILLFAAKLSTLVLLLPINAITIISSFILIFIVIMIGYLVGLYFIKFKPVTSLLQSD